MCRTTGSVVCLSACLSSPCHNGRSLHWQSTWIIASTSIHTHYQLNEFSEQLLLLIHTTLRHVAGLPLPLPLPLKSTPGSPPRSAPPRYPSSPGPFAYYTHSTVASPPLLPRDDSQTPAPPGGSHARDSTAGICPLRVSGRRRGSLVWWWRRRVHMRG